MMTSNQAVAVSAGSNILESAIDPDVMPQAVGYRMAVEPIEVEETTQSGIVLAATTMEAKEHVCTVGRVVNMGPLCYTHDKFADPRGNRTRWCEVGDYVLYNPYSGSSVPVRRNDGGIKNIRVMNDDEILCRVPDPTMIRNYL